MAITNDLIKIDIKSCAKFTKPVVKQERNDVFDNLIFSKARDDADAVVTHDIKRKGGDSLLSASNITDTRTQSTVNTSESRVDLTPQTSQTADKVNSTMKRVRKLSLAQKVMKQRKSLVPDSCSGDKGLINKCLEIQSTKTPVTAFKDNEEDIDEESLDVRISTISSNQSSRPSQK